MDKYLNIAYKLAIENDKEPRHSLAAIIVKGGAIVNVGVNLERQGRCAERRALRPNQDFKGCTLYVVRSNRRISKPCSKCMQAIVNAGIKWLVYINQEQKPELVRVER